MWAKTGISILDEVIDDAHRTSPTYNYRKINAYNSILKGLNPSHLISFNLIIQGMRRMSG